MQTCLAVVLIPLALTACLDTPPAASSFDAAVHDATKLDVDAEPPDAEPPDAAPPACSSGECEQLLAIGLWRHDPSNASSVALLRRDASTGTWQRLADAPNSPDSNIFDLDWGDCCGASGIPDELPDLIAAGFYALHVSEMRRPVDTFTPTAFVNPPQPDSPGGGAQGVWTDVDGDGDLDILTGLPNLRWHRNTTPGFDSPVSLDGAVAQIILGSWDDDDKPEILLSDRREPGGTTNGRGITVLDHTAGGWDTFVPVRPSRADNLIWCDVYDDPHPDLVVAGYYSMYIYPNRGSAVDSNWLDMVAVRTFPAPGQLHAALACGDVDGDGLDDLLVGTSTGLSVVYHGTPATSLVWDQESVGTMATFVSDLVLADLDHDGLPEILLTLGDDIGEAEPSDEPVAYLLPNQTSVVGDIELGMPEVLVSSRVDGMSLAFVEFVPPPR